MSFNTRNTVNRVLGLNDGSAETRRRVNQMYGRGEYNPFVGKNGSLFNPYLNYRQILNNPSISAKAKSFIAQATGLSPTASAVQPSTTPETVGGSFASSASSAPSSLTDGGGIVSAAKKYIGTPYVWGGESAAEGGMDCSGFVYNALKDAGYKVGRTTAQGYRGYGSAVSKADMQPGDLVFFGKGNNASHIGIYIGNGQMIHSSGGSKNTKSNPGKGVSITNVDYRNDFLEARRY